VAIFITYRDYVIPLVSIATRSRASFWIQARARFRLERSKSAQRSPLKAFLVARHTADARLICRVSERVDRTGWRRREGEGEGRGGEERTDGASISSIGSSKYRKQVISKH